MPGGLRAAAGAEQAPQGDIGSSGHFRMRDIDDPFRYLDMPMPDHIPEAGMAMGHARLSATARIATRIPASQQGNVGDRVEARLDLRQ